MPLPALDLDTRTWADLVDEGRSIVPRTAPAWDEHNFSDPGITLIELLAWVVEQDIYRVNRVPERNRRKFLRLAGFAPEPPHAATAAFAFTVRGGAVPFALPPGVTIAAGGVPFRTTAALDPAAARVAAVQTWDGRAWADETKSFQSGAAFSAYGADPLPSGEPAFLLGLDAAPRVGQELSVYIRLSPSRSDERARILAEAGTTALPPHHSLRVAWEVNDGAAWQTLAAADVLEDSTRGLTLDGPVRLHLPVALGATVVGAVAQPLYWLRCRMVSGAPDVPPLLADVAVNAVEAVQRTAARERFTLLPGAAQPVPAPGASGSLALDLDDAGDALGWSFGPAVDGPVATVLAAAPRTPTTPGTLEVTLDLAGRGTGGPDLELALAEDPVAVADGTVAVWSGDAWTQRPDLDAAAWDERVYAVEPAAGTLEFGNALHGAQPDRGEPVFASYDRTLGAAGPVGGAATCVAAGADDSTNAMLLPGGAPAVDGAFVVSPVGASWGGADAESVAHAQGRAAAALWAHERLLELCPPGSPQTLDQADRSAVLAHVAPERAATLLDFERLALDVPGVTVRRARAWAGVDPREPCLRAPGTVTVVVVGGLPAAHPEPTAELLAAVRRFLDPRRLLGTRLRVTGPTWVDVAVSARVQALPGSASSDVQQAVRDTLTGFLDPFTGGPRGRGWPFGRAVYRTELLEVVDRATGVDHVLDLTLTAGGDGGCGDACIPPTGLPRGGAHTVEVQS